MRGGVSWLMGAAALVAVLGAGAQGAAQPASVAGRVRLPDGGPAAGAKVRLLRFAEDALPRAIRDHRRVVEVAAEADERGAFRLPAAAGRWYWLAAEGGELRTPRFATRVVAGDFVTLTLAPARRVTGRVVLPDGGPAAGATVRAFSLESPENVGLAAFLEEARAGEGGAFAFLVPRDLHPVLEAEKGDLRTLSPAQASGPAPTTLALAEPVEVETVVRDPAGRPVSGAVLFQVDAEPPLPRELARTGPEGTARVRIHGTGTQVLVQAGGFGLSGWLLVPSLPPGVDDPEEEGPKPRPTPLTLSGDGHTVTGVLRGADGQPLADRRLLLHGLNLAMRGEAPLGELRWELATDEDGRFHGPRLPGWGFLTVYLLEIRDGEDLWMPLAARSLAAVEPRGAPLELTLQVGPPGAARITVLDPTGAPVPSPLVLVHPLPAPGHQPMHWIPSRITFGNRAGRTALVGLGPGPYRLMAVGSGLGRAFADLEVAHGRTTARTLRLEAGRAVHGRVLDATGNPAAGASVVAQPMMGGGSLDIEFSYPGFTAATDGRGRFRLGGLPAGEEIWITVEHPTPEGRRSATQVLDDPEEREMEIRLEG